VARALKKVYASLWNERAFEERAYWGIDHRLAYMGIAVEPSFVLEKLDAVAVTNLDAGDGGALYRVVSQGERQGVVRPADPTLVAETMTFRRGADGQPAEFKILTPSSLSPAPLWTDAKRAELATLLFQVHDHFATKVYPMLVRPSIDVEIKLTRDDRIVFKQARPYLQTTP
jgi:pyruvate,water dikinase